MKGTPRRIHLLAGVWQSLLQRKRWVYRIVLLVLLPAFALSLSAQEIRKQNFRGHEVAANEVLVKFRAVGTAAASAALAQVEQKEDVDESRGVGGAGWVLLHSRSKDATTLVREVSVLADVVYAEPNFIVYLADRPNDPRFGELWGMENTGQVIQGVMGTPGADIGAVPAWDISTGSRDIVVGVVDTGIFYAHPDLAANVWSAPAAFSVTIGTDTINCAAGTHGFDAIRRTCIPLDNDPGTHGTHVSGIIGAVGNNSLGVAGVNWTTSLMGLKMFDVQGGTDTATAVNAIEFAVQAKRVFASTRGANVRVLNNSWETTAFSQALLDEITITGANDILFVAAAGNGRPTGVGFDIDTNPVYPAFYGAPTIGATNVLAVAATDNRDARAGFSNFGATSVHLGAPGVSVLSTTLASSYGYKNGTSMAAPHVSGAAALILSHCNLTTPELKAALLNNVDNVPALAGITVTGGRLNVDKAIRAVCQSPRFAYVPNAGDGTVSIYAVINSTGQLRANGYVLAGTSPQAVTLDPSGQFAYVANRDSNNISAYSIDTNTGALKPVPGSPFRAGAAPRSVAVATSVFGPYLYAANENSGNVSAYKIDGVTGALTQVPGSPFRAGANPFAVTAASADLFLYAANFGSDNVSAYKIDSFTGALSDVPGSPFPAGLNPRAVTGEVTGQYLYVANAGAGTVSAYTIDLDTGFLNSVPGSPFTAGAGASAVTVSPSGKFVYVTNPSAGNISAYSIDPGIGALLPIPGSPFAAGNGPLAVALDPGGKYAFVTHSRGNEVWSYSVNSDGSLVFLRKMRTRDAPSAIAVSSGDAPVTYTPKFLYTEQAAAASINPATSALTPVDGSPFPTGIDTRWVAADPSGKFVYVANHGGTPAGIYAYSVNDASGALTAVLGSPFPTGGFSTRSVTVDPSGRFAYAANRAFPGTVSAYTIDATTGALTQVLGSPFPASRDSVVVTVDPTGQFAYTANQSGSVSAYRIDPVTGALRAIPGSPFPAVVTAWWVTVDPTGQFVYVVNPSGSVSAYTISAVSGALTPVPGPPFPANNPLAVAVEPSGRFAYVTTGFEGLVSYAIVPATGALTRISSLPGATGLAVATDPSGRFVYFGLGLAGTLAYTIDGTTGVLTLVPGSPFPTPGQLSLAITGTIR